MTNAIDDCVEDEAADLREQFAESVQAAAADIVDAGLNCGSALTNEQIALAHSLINQLYRLAESVQS